MPVTFGTRIAHCAEAGEEALAASFASGHAAAYETAYRAFGGRMYAAALRVVRDPEEAGECVHDVFAHLWRRRGAYAASRGGLEAFLVVCARNRALMHLRDARRRRATIDRLEPPGQDAFDDDPIERERIRRALAQLTPGQAEVVHLAYYGGMTLTEVAAHVNVPVGTVKTRLSAALASLRRRLIPVGNDGT